MLNYMFVAVIIIMCRVYMYVLFQEKLLGHLGVVLYEYLGEEYPEVLGSILGGLKVSPQVDLHTCMCLNNNSIRLLIFLNMKCGSSICLFNYNCVVNNKIHIYTCT